MKHKHFIYALALTLVAGVAWPLHAKKKNDIPERVTVEFPTAGCAHGSALYSNLDYGVRIVVRDNVSQSNIVNLTELPTKDAASFPKVIFDNSLSQAVEECLANTMAELGFNLNGDYDTDYVLEVTVKDYRLRVTGFNAKQKRYTSSAAMVLSWRLLNSDNEVVISATTTTGRASANELGTLFQPLTQAYRQAIADIAWDRIAPKLKIARSAKQEKNKAVTGKGDTALESSVIRWYIVSAPQGADVSWRVVSSTPDVANTNSNYVGTTPYETTESFDIKGLTYNNSGNVQIEIECSRNGYLPQKKRFNLRQVIDQKEISAKFNLVKESAEE